MMPLQRFGPTELAEDRSVSVAMTVEPARIKLLEFLGGLAFGGTERQVRNLFGALDRSRFELHTGCLKAIGHLTSEFQSQGASFAEYRIDCLYNKRALKQLLRLAGDIRRHRIDIVHSYGFYSNVFAIPAARLGGAPVVVASIRDMGNVWTPWQRRVQRLVCTMVDCVLVNAEAVKHQLVSDGYDREKICVIGNGVALPEQTAEPGKKGLHQEFGLPPRAPLVAMLSVLRREKGIEYFLKAAQLVSSRCPQARFLVVGDSFIRAEGNNESLGDSSYRQELEQCAHNLGLDGRVIFTGFRLDVAEVLSQVSISVLPTLSEALSNAILESMAAGVPVVATLVGGNPEAVVDGVTGLLVPPRDPASLADAISVLLENPELAYRMGEAGRIRVLERFSVEAMVRATENLYLELNARATRSSPDRRSAA